MSLAEEKKEHDYMFKVILVGLSGVGKSNILLRYTRDEFSSDWQTTLGVEYAAKTVTTSQGTRIKLQIWDTAGQEKYRYSPAYLGLS
jgi:small GTP-binding protein